jgi:hypothetical protein
MASTPKRPAALNRIKVTGLHAVSGSGGIGRSCAVAKRFPQRDLIENAQAFDLSHHDAPLLRMSAGPTAAAAPAPKHAAPSAFGSQRP